MGWRVVAGEQVHHNHVARIAQTCGEAVEHLPGVAVSDSDTPGRVPGGMAANKVNEFWLPLDDLLPGTRSCCLQVSGESQCATTQVKGGEGGRWLSGEVNNVTDSANVFKLKNFWATDIEV